MRFHLSRSLAGNSIDAGHEDGFVTIPTLRALFGLDEANDGGGEERRTPEFVVCPDEPPIGVVVQGVVETTVAEEARDTSDQDDTCDGDRPDRSAYMRSYEKSRAQRVRSNYMAAYNKKRDPTKKTRLSKEEETAKRRERRMRRREQEQRALVLQLHGRLANGGGVAACNQGPPRQALLGIDPNHGGVADDDAPPVYRGCIFDDASDGELPSSIGSDGDCSDGDSSDGSDDDTDELAGLVQKATL